MLELYLCPCPCGAAKTDDTRFATHTDMSCRPTTPHGEAESVYRNLIESRTQEHGAMHEKTLQATRKLGEVLIRRNKLDEAEKMYRHAVQGLTELFPQEQDNKEKFAAVCNQSPCVPPLKN